MGQWRNTWKPARFFMMDARSAVPLLGAMLHLRLWTIMLSVIIIGIFWWLERLGLTFPAALRALRRKFAGRYRSARRREKTRYPVDYGRTPRF